MKAVKKISKLLGAATLVLALGMLDISMKPKTTFRTDNGLVSFVDRLSLVNEAMAGTDILTGGDGSLPQHLRFMYFLINGAPNGYPAGMDGPEGGFLGMIRQITGPTALGGGLKSAGYSVCADVPATGNASMTDEGGTFTMYFETPLKTIPTGYTGAGTTFEKRVVVKHDGTTFMNIEFNCSTTVGWMRMAMGDGADISTGTRRNIEVYYDTNDSAASKLELYMYNEPGTATGNEYFVAKFQTLSSSTYKFWIIRAEDKDAGDNGFRAAVYGDITTHNTNAYLHFTSGAILDSTATYTDTGDVATGDAQCIDYTTPASPVAGAGCGSLSLDATAGNPLIDTGDSFSINWTANTTTGLKNDMTVLADPVNP